MRELNSHPVSDERLREQVQFYGQAHDISLANEREIAHDSPLRGGLIWGSDPVVYFMESSSEIGVLPLKDALRYLTTGEK